MALPFSGLIMLLCTVLIALFVAYWYGHPSSGGIKQWAIVVWVGMILIMTFGGVRRIINANPEQLRSAIVNLSARTRQHEERVGFVARTDPANEMLSVYQVSADAPGAARVRSARSEILIPNVAYR